MGSIALQPPTIVPSSDRCEPGSIPLATAQFPAASEPRAVDANDIAATWVSAFNTSISNPSIEELSKLFLSESYWRDQLCLTWDFHTLSGPAKIRSLLSDNPCRIASLALDKSSTYRSPKTASLDNGKVQVVQAFLKVETDVGNGEGFVRLVEDAGVWKVFTLFTFLKSLHGFEEGVGKKRPNGVEHGQHRSRENWADRRRIEEGFENGEEPTVLILGTLTSPLPMERYKLTSTRRRTRRPHSRSQTKNARHKIPDRRP